MEKLTVKKLKFTRILIMLAGMAAAFILWLRIPVLVENNRLIHFGDGRYGSKLGFLLIVMLPLLGLIPKRAAFMDPEIHADDAGERAKIEDERERESEKIKTAYTACYAVVACLIMILVIVLG